MMSEELNYFQRAGSVDVSAGALSLARKFGETIAATQSGKWIVVFSWYKSQTITDPRVGTTVHMGPGIDIGAMRASKVPPAAICEKDGFRYAMQIPDWIVAAAPRRLIDLNAHTPPSVELL